MIGRGGSLLVVSHLFDAVSEEQWQLASSLLMMMVVGEDIVFCANVMVLQLSFILSCAGLVVAGLIMCEHQLVYFTKGSLQNSKCAQHWSLPNQHWCFSLDPIHEVLLAFRSEVLSSRVDTSVHVHTERWVCLPRSSCCLEWTDFWKKRAMMVVDTFRVLQKTSYNVSQGRCLPSWMCIEEIDEDLHNQCICSKTKRKHWFHVD